MAYQTLHDTLLEQFYNEDDPLYTYVKELNSQMPGGTNIVGGAALRRRILCELAGLEDLGDRLSYAPGDRTVVFESDNDKAKIGLGAPIAYDVWYIYPAGNMLEFGDKSIAESMMKIEDYLEAIGNQKPLKMSSGGLSGVSIDCDGFEYTIKEARFESWLMGNGPMFDSGRPKEKQLGYVGYIAFPIGPVGVMWRISLTTESSITGTHGKNVLAYSDDNKTLQGGDLFPPFDVNMRENCGEMIMNKGYILDDDSTCELFAEGFNENPQYHKWLRYWIKDDNTNIIPGEFVGLSCRPWPLHCWFKQETSPFVYSGSWNETEFYTSGIVKQVWEEDEYNGDDDEIGRRYEVWVKNESIIIKSSDFLEYNVGERVGILKTYRDGNGGSSYGGNMIPSGNGGGTTNFSWEQLELQNTGSELNTEWVIVPVDFYGTGGNSIGGT